MSSSELKGKKNESNFRIVGYEITEVRCWGLVFRKPYFLVVVCVLDLTDMLGIRHPICLTPIMCDRVYVPPGDYRFTCESSHNTRL